MGRACHGFFYCLSNFGATAMKYAASLLIGYLTAITFLTMY